MADLRGFEAWIDGGLVVAHPRATGVIRSLSNEIGVITYVGRPPTFLAPPAAPLRPERCAYCGTRAHGRHCDSCGAPT